MVSFHELAPRLTRIEVTLDFEPHGMLEKMGRGMRFAKRAVRADLHRFKAIVELDEEAEGGWRGTIEEGKVKRRTERKPSRSRGAARAAAAAAAGGSRRAGTGRKRPRRGGTPAAARGHELLTADQQREGAVCISVRPRTDRC